MERETEKFIVTWTMVLFSVAACISYILIHNGKDIVIGLTIGTFASLLKFLINSHNFSKILKTRVPNAFNLILINTFNLMLFFVILYLILNKFNLVNVYAVIGVFIGVGFIPLVILVGGILQSLYIIRNKF